MGSDFNVKVEDCLQRRCHKKSFDYKELGKYQTLTAATASKI